MNDYQLSTDQQQVLLDLAKKSIAHGLKFQDSLAINPKDYSPALQDILSSFVTLHLNQKLRGCIGGLEAIQPLVDDVVKHAYAAAFRDPRFPPLAADEFAELKIEISILSPQQVIHCASEEDLLSSLRPGIDGLVLKDGYHHSTFLPSVWEQIPEPAEFLHQLKLKAGLPSNYWSSTLKAYRYTTFSFSQ